MNLAKHVLLCLTLMALVIAAMYGLTWPVIFAMEGLERIADPTTRNLLGIGLFLIELVAIAVGVYLGGIVWLCFWRFFASRAELERLVFFMGMKTRFDAWLFEKLLPPGPPDSKN